MSFAFILPATTHADGLKCPTGEKVRYEIMESQKTPSALTLALDVANKILPQGQKAKSAQFYYIIRLTLIEEPTEDGGLRCHYYEMEKVDPSEKDKYFFTMTLEPLPK